MNGSGGSVRLSRYGACEGWAWVSARACKCGRSSGTAYGAFLVVRVHGLST